MRVRYLSGRRVPVSLLSLHPSMEFANEQVWIVYRHVLGRDPIITGGQEDAHSNGSLHFGLFPDPRARALDYDDDEISEDQKIQIKQLLEARLGNQFDVVWESHHLHIEYQVRYF